MCETKSRHGQIQWRPDDISEIANPAQPMAGSRVKVRLPSGELLWAKVEGPFLARLVNVPLAEEYKIYDIVRLDSSRAWQDSRTEPNLPIYQIIGIEQHSGWNDFWFYAKVTPPEQFEAWAEFLGQRGLVVEIAQEKGQGFRQMFGGIMPGLSSSGLVKLLDDAQERFDVEWLHGRVLADVGDFERALKHLLREIEIEPYGYLAMVIGKVLVDLDRPQEALGFFKWALAMESQDGPERAHYLEEMAFCYEALGDHNLAEETMKAAVASYDDPQIRENLVAMLLNHGKKAEAARFSRKHGTRT